MLVFKTRSGITMEFINDKLYTSNLDEIHKALKEDLNGNDITALFCAMSVRDMLRRYEVIQIA